MDCPESLRTQAYFDGELDASSAIEIEGHLGRCASCRGTLQDLEYLRTVVRQIPRERPPPELRARIRRALDREGDARHGHRYGIGGLRWKWHPFWTGALSGVGACAVAALMILFFVPFSSNEALLHDLAADQVRSLMPSHLIDVVSTDQHTVKPWFAGHADVSPVVVDFAREGYRLIGGRADYLAGQRSAVVVYQHGRHVINVFAWLASKGPLPSDTTRSGYHMAFWRAGDLGYCAVSDTGWQEVRGLKQLLQAADHSG